MADEAGGPRVHRPLMRMVSALCEGRHYRAAVNMLHVYPQPLEMFGRYLLGTGAYPRRVEVRTPIGPIPLTLFSKHDVLTMNEIFCRGDYPATGEDSVFVDFGSNIGISAAFFLSRGTEGFAYLFEPVPENVDRLKSNLARFAGRYSIERAAVSTRGGEAQFGVESTGRYGGIGRNTGRFLTVKCRSANEILEEILRERQQIDVLKIDIETFEREIMEAIPYELAIRIGRIYVETEQPFDGTPLAATHDSRRYGLVSQFFRRRGHGGH